MREEMREIDKVLTNWLPVVNWTENPLIDATNLNKEIARIFPYLFVLNAYLNGYIRKSPDIIIETDPTVLAKRTEDLFTRSPYYRQKECGKCKIKVGKKSGTRVLADAFDLCEKSLRQTFGDIAKLGCRNLYGFLYYFGNPTITIVDKTKHISPHIAIITL
jgi:hypothetical protein